MVWAKAAWKLWRGRILCQERRAILLRRFTYNAKYIHRVETWQLLIGDKRILK